MNKEHLTVPDVAKVTKVSSETVRRWIRTKKLKASRDSKKDGWDIFYLDLFSFIRHNPKYLERCKDEYPHFYEQVVTSPYYHALIPKKDKKTNTCNFCQEKTTGYYNDDILAKEIRINNGRPFMNIYAGLDDNDILDIGLYTPSDDPIDKWLIKINYCPMCGRKIKED